MTVLLLFFLFPLALPLPSRRTGLVMPFLWGDGGRAKENAATSYAYRIKNLYPRS